MKISSWLQAHIQAHSYFVGVPRILTPDNAKVTAVKNTHTELIRNRSYQEMAEYYGTAIVPARPVSQKDKASVEGTVGVLSTWIVASMRNDKFFSFQELDEFNSCPFQKRKGCRLSAIDRLRLSVYEVLIGGRVHAGTPWRENDRNRRGR